ncbi:MAG: glycosyltransferase family 2 protein [Planctomycetota bacterium]
MTLVSAVIPCFRRADAAARAVLSVLAQRLPTGVSIEAVACLDGPQPEVRRSLASIADRRARIVELPLKRGHAAARNHGIAHARGEWVGLLDDDDLWMPDKVQVQLDAASAARSRGVENPIVACRVEARLERGSLVWPERTPRDGESIGDYLYRRRGPASLRSGRTMVQTSMILARRDLFERVPFRSGLRRHADPDWLLRAAATPGTRVVFPDEREPLAVWSLHDGSRVSAHGDWRYSIAWARRHCHQMSGRAAAGFLTGPAAHRAGQLTHGSARLRAFYALARHAFAIGRPSVWDAAALALFCFDVGRLRPTARASSVDGRSV